MDIHALKRTYLQYFHERLRALEFLVYFDVDRNTIRASRLLKGGVYKISGTGKDTKLKLSES